jgi:activator of HSP90 ATPase
MQPSSPFSRRRMLLQSAATAGGLLLATGTADAEIKGIQAAEAIHQEITFNASAKRVYELLTVASLFHKVELLSDAAHSVDVKAHPAAIQQTPGGSISLFGNYITGRQVELVQDKRIVWAWRPESWVLGVYSMVHMELFGPRDGITAVILDHTGFPKGTADHLADGWYANYWEPMQKVLG